MNEIAIRASINELEHHRNRALDLFGRAYDLAKEAAATAASAAPSGHFSLPSLRHSGDNWGDDRDKFMERTRREVDKGVWNHLLRATGLDTLMDKTAKEQFRAQLEKDPPPATADNCRATMQQLIGDADTIFKRGIATAFSRLDRRFRSHDGFKVGARMVLSYFADRNGYISHGGREETLLDVERTFYVLDGKTQPDRDGGILGALATARRGALGGRFMDPATYTAESDYFRVRVFKNGNAHVWFKRDDLVERVNQLLADYYGAALGAGADVADRHHEPARTPDRNMGFFESPREVVERVLSESGLWKGMTTPKTVLEPSAGLGAIALAADDLGALVTCIEADHGRALQLGAKLPNRVFWRDFLETPPEMFGPFDVVLMNPPFDGQRDIDHVTHALRFVKPGGKLVAVMSAGVEFRENAKAVDFRAQVERRRGRFIDLPAGSFAESGTMVNTVLCVIPC